MNGTHSLHHKLHLDDHTEQAALERLLEAFPAVSSCRWTLEKENDGLTNVLFKCSVPSGPTRCCILRFYGHGSDSLIDREREQQVIEQLSAWGLAAKLILAFPGGLLYEYVEGEVADVPAIRENYVLIARHMRRFHQAAVKLRDPSLPGNSPDKPLLLPTIHKWIGILKDRRRRQLYTDALRQVAIPQDEFPVAWCHNDLLCKNVILQSPSQVAFIDFEYAGYNFAAFDVANHLAEYAGLDKFEDIPDDAFIRSFLEAYLRNGDNDAISPDTLCMMQKQVRFMLPLTHLFWAVWADVQHECSTIDFDYVTYAKRRFAEFEQTFTPWITISNQ
jgi:ethanolamine kinase